MSPRSHTVHLVYPHGEAISCPDAIGRKLGEQLEATYGVRHYDWDGRQRIEPAKGDVLIGHPHPSPRTTFRMSFRDPGWSRVLMLNPFNLDLRQVAWMNGLIGHCDLYLAITGNYWYSAIDRSPVAHWLPKMVHVDLAVDPVDFPRIKNGFGEPGRRRFLYIGHSGWQKNPGYLSEIAERLPGADFGWIGGGTTKIGGFTAHGSLDFREEDARAVAREYDFLLTVSLSDANPATILEAMAWGLIPVCTPQSGYSGYGGIVNIPAGDPESAAAILSRLQTAAAGRLERTRSRNDELLSRHFTWERFAQQVSDSIESTESPALGPQSPASRASLRWAEVSSPYSLLRPRNLGGAARTTAGDLKRALWRADGC